MFRTHPGEAALYDIPAGRLARVTHALEHLSHYGDAVIAPTEYGDLVAIAEGWTDERRAERLAAAAGADIAYSENWTTCDNCGILVYTDLNLMGGGLIWVSDCGIACRHCLESDEEIAHAHIEYAANAQENDRHAAPAYLEVDPVDYGYQELIRFKDVPGPVLMPAYTGAVIAQAHPRGRSWRSPGYYDSHALYVPVDDQTGLAAMPDGYSLDGNTWTAPDNTPAGGQADTPAAAILAAWTHYLWTYHLEGSQA